MRTWAIPLIALISLACSIGGRPPASHAADFFSRTTASFGCQATPPPSISRAPILVPPTATPKPDRNLTPGPESATRTFLASSIVQNGQEMPLGTQLRVTLGEWCRGGFYAGCNHHGFIWAVVDGRLRVEDMSVSLIGCEDHDPLLRDLFRSAPSVTLDGDTLKLESGNTVITLIEDRTQ